MLMEAIDALIIVLVSATLGSMIGVGGGFIIVPLLTLLMGLPIRESIGLSLLAIVAVASSASITYTKAGYVNYRVGLMLETTTVIGAIIGAWLCILLSQRILTLLFGLLLIYVGYRMLRNIQFKSEEYIELDNRKMLIGMLSSFLAGLASGLLGIGGGVLKVPIMVLVLGLPTKIAIGTSEFMISITSVSGSYVHFREGILNPYLAASVVIGGFIGAQFGSRLSVKVKAKVLRRVFGMVMIFFSILMILKGLGVCI